MTEQYEVCATVKVIGLVAGDPPTLAFSKRLRGMDGKEKLFTQRAIVEDMALFQRLYQGVKPGDEITATLVTKSWDDGVLTYVRDFST